MVFVSSDESLADNLGFTSLLMIVCSTVNCHCFLLLYALISYDGFVLNISVSYVENFWAINMFVSFDNLFIRSVYSAFSSRRQ